MSPYDWFKIYKESPEYVALKAQLENKWGYISLHWECNENMSYAIKNIKFC